ncbi:hypothetical protein, partial [Enterobacter hormaechei]
FCEGENIFALYPAHMASRRFFIPGELKIFHGGTPVLAPHRAGETSINRFVNKKTLTNTIHIKCQGEKKRSKKQLTQNQTATEFIKDFFF